MFAWKRNRKGTEDLTYSYAFDFKEKKIVRKTAFTNHDDAISAARDHLHALQVGAYDIAHALRQRKAPIKLPLLDLTTAYEKAPSAPGRAGEKTRTANVNALKTLLRASGLDLATVGVDVLTDRLVWTYKAGVETKAAAEEPQRQQQLCRSANSTLRQARSLFSKDMREYYARFTQLQLPDLTAFLAAGGFRGVTKQEYNPPADVVLARTFAALEKLAAGSADDKNAYKACWLAIGFGLRASEISRARRSWFISRDGAVWVAGPELAKNKKFPQVRGQFGAWSKLEPLMNDLKGDDHVLVGTQTERTETVFRRISEWMRAQGWQTQHHIHELRAWAGCQIAERSPNHLLDAQTFMRHATYDTTEKYYGHHMKRRLDEVTLELPKAPAAIELKVINGGAI